MCPVLRGFGRCWRVWTRIGVVLPGWRGSGGCELGGGQSPPLGELEHVVGEADEAPFVGDLVEPAHQELTKAAGLLDLPEHRLGQLLAQSVWGVVAAGPDLVAQSRRPLGSAFAVGRML